MSDQENGNLTFSQALEYLKNGKCVAREGWNGKGMYLAVQEGTTIPRDKARGGIAKQMANENYGEAFPEIVIQPHIDLRSAQGTCCVGWLPPVDDLFANDWYVIHK